MHVFRSLWNIQVSKCSTLCICTQIVLIDVSGPFGLLKGKCLKPRATFPRCGRQRRVLCGSVLALRPDCCILATRWVPNFSIISKQGSAKLNRNFVRHLGCFYDLWIQRNPRLRLRFNIVKTQKKNTARRIPVLHKSDKVLTVRLYPLQCIAWMSCFPPSTFIWKTWK